MHVKRAYVYLNLSFRMLVNKQFRSKVIYAVTDYDETIYTKLQGILEMRLRIQMYMLNSIWNVKFISKHESSQFITTVIVLI